MKPSQVLTIIPIVLICLLLAPCTLDQYQHQKIISIKAKFPAKIHTNSTNNLNRPEGTDASYVPSFVDRIELKLFDGDIEILSETNIKSADGNISNEFEIEEVRLSSDHTIKTTVYTDTYTDSTEGKVTHRATASLSEINNSFENTQITLNLETQSGTQLYDNILSINVGSIPTRLEISDYYPFCIDINPALGFYISWVANTGTLYVAKGDFPGSSIDQDDIATNAKIPRRHSCKYVTEYGNTSQDFLLVPIVSGNTKTLKVLLFNGFLTHSTPYAIPEVPEATAEYDLKDAYMDAAFGKIAFTYHFDDQGPPEPEDKESFQYVILDKSKPSVAEFNAPESGAIFVKPQVITEEQVALLMDTEVDRSVIVYSSSRPGLVNSNLSLSSRHFADYFILPGPEDQIVMLSSTLQLLKASFHEPVLPFPTDTTKLSSIDYIDRKDSFIKPYREVGYVILLSDDSSDSDGNSDISYFLMGTDGLISKEGVIFSDATSNNYDDTTPQIAINEEGLAVVAWHSEDGNIYIKRYLF